MLAGNRLKMCASVGFEISLTLASSKTLPGSYICYDFPSCFLFQLLPKKFHLKGANEIDHIKILSTIQDILKEKRAFDVLKILHSLE